LFYRLWDKTNERYLTDDDCYCIGIRSDGRVIQYDAAASSYGDTWLSTEDVTDKYDIHIDTFEELSK
jgi:hypothetical protein